MKRGRSSEHLDETRLIERIRRWLGDASPAAPEGIGDDCAVVRASKSQLITVDPVVAGIHYSDKTPAAAIAAKLLKRNLSDIAAMGGTPRHAVISIALPPRHSLKWLQNFFRGLARCARRYHVQIVGGDCTATSGPFVASLTLLGDAPRRPLTRTTARAGDRLYVTGTLGGSLLGRHLRFEPRLSEGQWLAAQPHVHAAVDLSDGLGKDLGAILSPGSMAVVDTNALPASTAAKKLARTTARDLLDCVLNDGEDYELLFASSTGHHEHLTSQWRKRFATPLTCIGTVERHRRGRPEVRFEPPLPSHVRVHGHIHFR